MVNKLNIKTILSPANDCSVCIRYLKTDIWPQAFTLAHGGLGMILLGSVKLFCCSVPSIALCQTEVTGRGRVWWPFNMAGLSLYQWETLIWNDYALLAFCIKFFFECIHGLHSLKSVENSWAESGGLVDPIEGHCFSWINLMAMSTMFGRQVTGLCRWNGILINAHKDRKLILLTH